MKKKNIFITGITGFLGSFLAMELLKKGYIIYGLSRGNAKAKAKERVENALKFAYDDQWDPQLMRNVHVLEGDIVHANLGIKSSAQRKELAKKIDSIIHSAALAELNCPYKRIKRINVDGTIHVLSLAKEIKDMGRNIHFNHISTMYIAGKGLKEFDETMFDEGQEFNNTYEQTKFEAEAVVRRCRDQEGIPTSIFRPSMIMGESKKGKTANFRLIYQPLHFFANEIFQKFPADPESSQNLIHMDTAVETISTLVDFSKEGVFHVISPCNVTIQTFVDSASSYFGFSPPQLIPADEFDYDVFTSVQLKLVEPYIPYFNYKTGFFSKIDQISKTKLFVDSAMAGNDLKKVYQFCSRKGFIKKRKK